MRKLHTEEMSGLVAGNVASFCTGWAAGVGVALSFGWTLGPVGIGAVLIGATVCLAADSR